MGAVWIARRSIWFFVAATLALGTLAIASWWIDGAAGFFLTSFPIVVVAAHCWPGYSARFLLSSAALLGMALAMATTWNAATLARSEIEDVAPTNAISVFTNPWKGDPLRFRVAVSPGPSAVLYLGEADGTGVLVVGSSDPAEPIRTLRFSLSATRIEVHPGWVVC